MVRNSQSKMPHTLAVWFVNMRLYCSNFFYFVTVDSIDGIYVECLRLEGFVFVVVVVDLVVLVLGAYSTHTTHTHPYSTRTYIRQNGKFNDIAQIRLVLFVWVVCVIICSYMYSYSACRQKVTTYTTRIAYINRHLSI